MLDRITTGNRLLALRGNKTVREVSAAIGVSPGSWCMYESGKRTPRDEVKIRIAQYFGVEVSDIFFPKKLKHSKHRSN